MKTRMREVCFYIGLVMLHWRRALPAVLLLCNLGSAVACFAARDYRRGIYWIASAVCIASVAW